MENVIWLSITGIVIVVSILIYIANFKGELLSHFTLVAVICFLVEVFAPMVWQARGQTAYRYIEVMAYTPKASFYFIISYFSFCVCFILKSPLGDDWRVRRTDVKDYSDMKVSVLWGVYAFFFVLYIIYLALRGRSLLSQLSLGQAGAYSTDILNQTDSNLWFLMGSLNALISISLLLLFYQKENRLLVYLCYAVTMILTISSGWRHLMIDMVLTPLIVSQVLNKQRVKIGKYIIVAMILYLLVSWIGAMRDVYRTGTGSIHGYEGESAFKSLMVNIEVFFPYFAYVNYIPKYGYYCLGGTYLGGLLQLIPSFIWPGKSAVISAVKRTEGYYGAIGSVMSGGVADPYWSEAFRNGGLVGMIIMFGLLGIVVAKLRKRIYCEKVSDVVLYGLTASFMFQVLTRSFQNMLQDLVFLLLPFFLVRNISRIRIYRGKIIWTLKRDN